MCISRFMMKSYALRKTMNSFEAYLFIHTMQLLIEMFFISYGQKEKETDEHREILSCIVRRNALKHQREGAQVCKIDNNRII